MGIETHTDVLSEIARLRSSIESVAAAAEIALGGRAPWSDDDDPCPPPAEYTELCRQLAALRERVALAEHVNDGPRALRAELATLFFFAKTLHADAVDWRSTVEERIREIERQRAAARREQQRLAAEREKLAAEREKLAQRREALRLGIAQTAARMAEQGGGECRTTVPVFALGEGLAVCSVSVSWPRKGLRFAKRWLVTLNDSRDDVAVRRDY